MIINLINVAPQSKAKLCDLWGHKKYIAYPPQYSCLFKYKGLQFCLQICLTVYLGNNN